MVVFEHFKLCHTIACSACAVGGLHRAEDSSGAHLVIGTMLQTVFCLLLLLNVCQGAVPICACIAQSLVAQGEQAPEQLSLILGICQLRLQL